MNYTTRPVPERKGKTLVLAGDEPVGVITKSPDGFTAAHVAWPCSFPVASFGRAYLTIMESDQRLRSETQARRVS